MRRITVSLAALLLALSMVPLDSEAKRKKDRVPPELMAVVERVSTGRANFFLRNAFDTDPSPYLGRFVPAETSALNIDDAAAMQTACSQHISYRTVGGGGVQYDEYFNASTNVSASLGIPLLAATGFDAGADVGYSGGSVVRIRYTLTNKMVATIDDPEAFAECCEEGPGRCTGLYLGEFLEGSGELFHYTGTGTGVRAGAGAKGVELGVEVKDGVAWSRAVTFPNPVYFAFKTTTAHIEPLPEPCGPWTDQIPRHAHGMYFVGLSEIVDSERIARDQSMRDARAQVIRHVGEAISTGAIEIRSTSGAIGDLGSRLNQEEFVEAAAEGVAEFVKDRAWCVEEHPTPGGTRYSAKVLAFLPDKEEEAAAGVLRQLIDVEEVEGE
jgi:hypothetical protein